ncbi:transferase [Dactylonectria macrodidyma]|uniref:Transferase n=1 Tax=Dactylonectria macrodidyma TaxID=307937 RepID=A0A9P9FUJ8_9HYPO|nr:transferase [Dactylonectria macrodidyma]
MSQNGYVKSPLGLASKQSDEFTTLAQHGLPEFPFSQKLTSLDMNMPRLYGARWILCFPLQPGTDAAQVYKDLQVGLAHTIKSIPWIAGTVAPEEGQDPRHNRIQVVDSLAGIKFPSCDLTGTLPSYEELKKENFPLSKLSATQLGPIGVFAEGPPPVMAAQANFIQGGLLLTVGVHHAVCDASALDTIVGTWSANTAAASGSGSFTTYDAQSNDRSPLMKGMPGAQLDSFPEYRLAPSVDSPMPQMPAGFQMPPMATRIFRFSPEGLAGIKAAAAAFSTHDALCAFIWRHMTLARKIPGASVAGDETSALAFAVNIRGRTSPPLPPTYLGNASMASMTSRLPIPSLTADTGLSYAAAAIRKSLNAFNGPSRVPLTIGMLNSRPDATDFKLAYNAFLGPDIVTTSWADLTVYQTYWGILGSVESFRTPGDGADGVIVIYPRLKDGSLEVTVGLELGAMKRLYMDEEFNKVAQLWA